MKAWAAEGGKIVIKGMCLIKGMLYLKAWAAEGGKNFDKRKSGRVADDPW